MKKKKKKKNGPVIEEGKFLKEQLAGLLGTETPGPLFMPLVTVGVVGFGVGYVVGRRTRSQPDST